MVDLEGFPFENDAVVSGVSEVFISFVVDSTSMFVVLTPPAINIVLSSVTQIHFLCEQYPPDMYAI